MSDKDRQKKDGQRKDKQNQATRETNSDPQQKADASAQKQQQK
ncbi:MAG TPA: hypothetical protein VGC89_07740 [Pyrinomonadaceae bacterium]|jgi:hypothetical protein